MEKTNNSEEIYEYNEKDLRTLGQLYGACLNIVNNGEEDIYEESCKYPFNYFEDIYKKANKISKEKVKEERIEIKMAEFFNGIDTQDFLRLLKVEVPEDLQKYFKLGRDNWRELFSDVK